MEQYIHGNIGRTGYRYESSDPKFFLIPKHLEVMAHLVAYDSFCAHGDLPSEAHQCYWMVTSNLDTPGQPNRLFLQASGCDSFRSGFYAHGFMSNPETDSDLYGPRLLRLLRTRFMHVGEALAAAEQGNLPAIAADSLPIEEHLLPAELDPELLRNILMALLSGKKVILRLASSGRQAMEDSRACLLALYQRMPYALRAQVGFATGLSAGSVNDPTNPLPISIQLILMDADADAAGIISSPFQSFFDLTSGAQTEPMPREADGNSYAPLIDYLVQTPAEELDPFFRDCQQFMVSQGKEYLTIEEYLMLLQSFQIGSGAFTDDQIRIWAINLHSQNYTPEYKANIHNKLVRNLSWQTLAAHLIRTVPRLELLQDFGVLDGSDDLLQETSTIRDTNAARTLQMVEDLLWIYPEGTREMLARTLAEGFFSMGCQEHSCLRETQPAKKTVEALDALDLDPRPTFTTQLASEVKVLAYQALNQQRESVKAQYAKNLESQKFGGDLAIELQPIFSAPAFEQLYQQLHGYYLHDELLPGWNQKIAEKITGMCAGSAPQTLEDYAALLNLSAACRRLLESHGGSFTEAQNKTVTDLEASWEYTLGLSKRPCGDIPALLALWDEITAANLPASLTIQLKHFYSRAIRPDKAQILAAADKLSAHARDAAQRELLVPVVQSVPDLLTVGPEQTLADTKHQLTSVQTLAKAGLCGYMIDFQPWGVQAAAEELQAQIRQLETFRRGQASVPALDFGSVPVQRWILANFPDSTDLKLLLFLRCPNLRPGLLDNLATAARDITGTDLQLLYVTCCSEADLRTAGHPATQAWTQALETLFPQWPELPPALPPQVEPEQGPNCTGLIIGESVLLGLAGIYPGLMMMLFSTPEVLASGILAIVLALADAACLISGLVLPEKEQQRLLRWFGAALAPGFLLSVVQLVLAIL